MAFVRSSRILAPEPLPAHGRTWTGRPKKGLFLGGETAPNLSLNRITGGEARLADFALLSRKAGKGRFLLRPRGENKSCPVHGAFLPCLRELPPALRQRLTLDNGSELAGFRELERAGLMPLLLQAAFALAARNQRGRSWSAAAVLPRRQPLAHDHGSTARESSSSAEQAASQMLNDQTPAGVVKHILHDLLAI